MSKRTIPLLFAVAVMLIAAVPAQADHCWRCRFFVDYSICSGGRLTGTTDCDDSSGECILSGSYCTHLASALTPLASEFEVASVERIDEKAPAPDDALVAKLDAPRPATESTR